MNWIFALLLFLFSVLIGTENERITFDHPEKSQLTFDYLHEDMGFLKELPRPEEKITNEQLTKLIREVDYVIRFNELPQIDELILPAYIANAQKDFAWLSYLQSGSLTGDLAPVTLWTLQLFIPDASLPSAQEECFDVYTCSIASIVVGKAAKRLQEERNQIADYPIRHGEKSWTHTSPGYRGLNFGSAKTWYLTSSDQYIADPPKKNEDFWQRQCDVIKEEQTNLNNKKVTAIYEWAGLTHIDAGSWDKILDGYLIAKQVSVAKRLYIRAIFLSAIMDSTASAFNSKYTYWIMRPSQLDSTVKPYIVIPNHPSYPSAHSTVSATAAAILTAFFPEDQQTWNALAEEAGMSRIWGGIHYPADHQAGKKLGKQIGETILKKN